MKKNLVMLFATFVAAVFLVGNLTIAVAGEPDKVKIEKIKDKKSGVDFDHKAHTAVAKCATCHHKGDNKSCFECHKKDKTDDCKVDYKKALHKNCIDCHKKEKKGPTKCKECHK
jgi:hypothetical protein